MLKNVWLAALLLVASTSEAAVRKCKNVSAKDIARHYIANELHGWRAQQPLKKKCSKRTQTLQAFEGFEDRKPSSVFVNGKSLKIVETKLLDVKTQTYGVIFSFDLDRKRKLYDGIVFNKKTKGTMTGTFPCSSLLETPRRVYIDSACKAGKVSKKKSKKKNS